MAMSSAERAKKVREERKSKNLCVGCGKVAPMSGYTQCELCNNKMKAAGKACREAKLKAGQCEKCDKPKLPDKARCADCLRDQRRFASDRYQRLRDAAIEAYGGHKCNCCGVAYKFGLELDHVDGGGNQHRREVGDTGSIYKWLRDNNYPAGMMQVLCAGCNRAKHLDGECKCKEHHSVTNI